MIIFPFRVLGLGLLIRTLLLHCYNCSGNKEQNYANGMISYGSKDYSIVTIKLTFYGL
jgi:hypothetical protein